MEFDELLVTTGVDSLVKLVKQKGKVELEECAKLLGIPSDTLEEWARILEEEGILRVEYKLTKIYLTWIQPSAAQVEQEKTSFEEEKKDVVKEVARTRSELAPEIERAGRLRESFAELYKRLYTRLDEMEKKLAPIVSKKESAQQKSDANLRGVSDALSEINKIKGEIGSMRKEMDEAETAVSKGAAKEAFAKFKKTQEEITGLMEELKELKKKMKIEAPGAVHGISMPSAADMRKKTEMLAKDFAEIKRRNAALREDIISLKEGSEITSTVGGSIKDYEKSAASLKTELSQLSKDAGRLFDRVKAVDEKLKENLDTIERFSDSLEVAKGIVRRFPTQDKILDEIEQLKKKEWQIEDKTNAIKKLLEIAGGKRVSAGEAEDLMEKIDVKIADLKEESDKISSSLEDEKSKYLTFQQIKDRIVPSIRNYQAEITKLEKELEEMKKATIAQQSEIKEEAKRFSGKMDDNETKKMLDMAKEVKEKKALLDEINSSISRLSEIAENLNRRLVLLSKEAQLLELRASGKAEVGEGGKQISAEEAEEKEEYVKEQLKLTKDEEKEFMAKREELRQLIKKLWENEGK